MASTQLEIVNMALGRIGQTAITQAELTAATATVPYHCSIHYAQARDVLLRSHWWRFATTRASLSAGTADAFSQWTYYWALPSDFLRLKNIWDDNDTKKEIILYSYEIEGSQIFTDFTPCKIKYIKQETTVTKFDPLFTELLILQLAKRLVIPIAGIKNNLREDIDKELFPLMRKARQIDKEEQNTVGRGEADTWNDALYGWGLRDPTKLGSN